MWNDIYEITLNLLLGIVGGIFSSVIVSYIFLIDSEYKNQINHARELTSIDASGNPAGKFRW